LIGTAAAAPSERFVFWKISGNVLVRKLIPLDETSAI